MRIAWILAAATGVFLAGCDGGHDHDSHEHKHGAAPAPVDTKVKDPVCAMTIEKGGLKTEFDTADVYFCSQVCVDKFKADPAKYLKACACARTMKNCACEHCEKKRVLCDCAEHK